MPPGADRVKAANAYVAKVEQAIKQALALRNSDIVGLYTQHGWDANKAVAELTGMPTATVRSIRGPASSAPDTTQRSKR